MATFNKQSVREEFDKIKASFDTQINSGKVPAETAALFNALIMLVGIILSIFMEKATKKTSLNSSIPPSQTGPDETAVGKGKKGSANGEAKVTTIGNTPVTLLDVVACKNCGNDLSCIVPQNLDTFS